MTRKPFVFNIPWESEIRATVNRWLPNPPNLTYAEIQTQGSLDFSTKLDHFWKNYILTAEQPKSKRKVIQISDNFFGSFNPNVTSWDFHLGFSTSDFTQCLKTESQLNTELMSIQTGDYIVFSTVLVPTCFDLKALA